MDDIEKKTEPVSPSETLLEKTPEFSDRFCNFEYIDSGGYGEVYKAIDKKLKQFVAIKVINKSKISSEKDYERIVREVKIARELNHPNLIRYFEIYESEKSIAIAMEYVDGMTIQEKIKKEGKFKEEEIKKILPSILEVIEYIHSNGVIHRDIKPSNLYITKNGEVKLGDFGIVYIEGEDKLTKTDQTIGTPTYMSPEQIGGNKLKGASDWYSLGITIYEMATGDVPFKGTAGEIMKGHLQEKIPPLKENKRLWKLIQGFTIKEPEKRWGYREVKKYIEEKNLPFLPKEKKTILISCIFLVILIFSILFMPKIITPEPTSLEYKGKKLKVYSKKKILFEKEMEREISDAKIMDAGRDKEIIVSYYLKPSDFETKNMLNIIKNADVLNKNLSLKYPIEIYNSIFYKKFQSFSFNYVSKIFPLVEIKNDKIFSNRNFYISTRHEYYPSLIHYFNRKYGFIIEVSNDGFITGVCIWEDKLVLLGYANPLLQQSFIAILKHINIGLELGDVLNIDLKNIISYYLLGNVDIGTNIYFSPENQKLKIFIVYPNKTYFFEKDGDLLGPKNGSGEKTKVLLENYSKTRIFINENELKRAKELINESIKLSEEYQLYGFSVLFASLLGEIYYLEGKINDGINICYNYAKKYKDYGIDLYVKAGIFAYLNGEYKKAIDLWNEKFYLGSPRFLEVKTFSIYASVLNEDWKKAEELLSSELSEGIENWKKYMNYQRGVMYLLRKNLNEAIKILKPSLDDLNMEDLAVFYFLSKVAEGNPDLENFEKYIKNYPKGPLYLQFAGACTKGEWEKAKFLSFQMEKSSVHDPGVALIYPVIKKIIKVYPELFAKLK